MGVSNNFTFLEVPFASWYGDTKTKVYFPEDWDLTFCAPRGAEPLTESELKEAIQSPIGTGSLSELAKGKKKIVILVDDLSRPTPTYRLMPYILGELRAGGASSRDILILAAVGTHRPLLPWDFAKKIGNDVAESIETVNHIPYEECAYLGKSLEGTPIYINKFVAEADLRIGVGSIIPYSPGGPGFGGGAKILVPGAAGMETIVHHHSVPGGESGSLEGNRMRRNIEDIAVKTGLDAIINVIINGNKDITGLFMGDVIEAYKKGVDFAREAYKADRPKGADIAFINSYPQDTALINAAPLYLGKMVTNEEGIIILHASCPEGEGHHTLSGRGGKWYNSRVKPRLNSMDRSVIVCSPHLTRYDVDRQIGSQAQLFRTWSELIGSLMDKFGGGLRVVAFPYGRLSLVKNS